MATPNALFAIMNVSSPDKIKEILKDVAPWVWLELEEGEWLLVAPSSTTTKEVSDRLGLTGAGNDTAMVLRVESYFGRNHMSVWEWITTKQGAELAISTTA
jgi:hypothetical protein